MKIFFTACRAALFCCLALALPAAAAAQDKAAYEKDLETKAQAALELRLGPGAVKVAVRAAADEPFSAEGVKKVTVFVALSGSAPEGEEAKVREISGTVLGLSAGRGDEVLVVKTGAAAPAKQAGGSGGYAVNLLWAIGGMLLAFLLSRARSVPAPAAPGPGITARTAAREKYVPPPPPPAGEAAPQSDELNIRSRSGFYKR